MTLAVIPTPISTGQVGFLPAVSPSPSTLHVLPRVTPAPSSNDFPTEVVVALTTTILIPDYPLYYDAPIFQFSPNYQALPDGSLIAAPYRSELQQDNGALLLVSILLTIFLRNVLVSGNYLRRIKVQEKIIFRMLFVSQVVAFVGLVPKITSFLAPHVNCTGVEVVVNIASTLSIILITTGILGYKAYKCLANSVFVLVTLAILTIGALSMGLADYITLRGASRLSGNCTRIDDMRWMRVFIVLQLAQSIFLCGCFFFAVWRSHRSPVARDCISVRLSLDFEGYVPSVKIPPPDRWDFVSGHKPEEVIVSHPQLPSVVPTEVPTRQSSVREESSALATPRLGRRVTQAESDSSLRPLSSGPASSLAPSTFSRISHYMPRLFRKVMKDELCYTAMITVCCAIVAIIAVVGVTSQGLLWFMSWACLYWAVTSILTTLSLGRAVSRHERESMLQAAALHTRRWENERARVTGVDRNFSSSNRIRRFSSGTSNAYSENPFDDTRAVPSANSDPMLSLPSVSSRSFSSRSFLPPGPSPTLQFPTSGRTTPLVPLDSTRAVLQGAGFIIDRNSSASESSYRLTRT
ncbi:hypothetical protein J3R30DRAFT_3820920 [Lentinula aciculospora]|uniref:Uncharacterized protein n=1 Tax=Lentinula aciculospora TaxID=153920 RepID=A0A9W9AQT9_9AGAR|nr:hypothetical protein J3R30DRAFT_3820920 [Lentinula aciculospora]